MDLLIEEHIIMQGNGQMCSGNYSMCCYFLILHSCFRMYYILIIFNSRNIII